MSLSLEGDFDPSVHFLGLIKKTIADGVPRRCSLHGGPQIIIAPLQMMFYSATSNLNELKALCLAQPFDLQIEAMPGWNPEEKVEAIQVGRMRLRTQAENNPIAGLSANPLAELLWFSSMAASKGRLLLGSRADDPVRLKQLPDVTFLNLHESYPQLARFMHESSADLLTVAKRTAVPLSQVFDFHNACAAIGYIERGNVFEPEEYFLGLVQKARQDGLMRRCVLPGLPPLYLVPADQRYYSQQISATHLAPLFIAHPGDVQVDRVDEFDKGGQDEEEEVIQIGRMVVRRKKETQAPSLAFGPLDELLWKAALQASGGRLMAGKRLGEIVRLKRWPDFSRLAEDRRFLPLAAFMSVNAASLTTVAKMTGAPLSQVIDFHNACAVLDLLESLPEERLHSRPVSDKDRAVYRTISRSLGGIRAAEHAG